MVMDRCWIIRWLRTELEWAIRTGMLRILCRWCSSVVERVRGIGMCNCLREHLWGICGGMSPTGLESASSSLAIARERQMSLLKAVSAPYARGFLCALTLTSLGSAASLIDAVQSGDREAVRSFVKKHVDVNIAENDGTTPLHWAARADDLETATLLIHAGA